MKTLKAFLAPSRDWRVRVYSLLIFVIFDYAMTGLFCREFSDEANAILRAIMIHFDNVPLGLTIFTTAFYIPVYVMLCYFTNHDWSGFMRVDVLRLISERVRPLFDVLLGLGVASRHFEGAMSWMLPLPNRLWLALGFVFYLSTVHMGTLLEKFRG
jgi:hypothetical protein